MQAGQLENVNEARPRAIMAITSKATFEQTLRFNSAIALEARLSDEAHWIDDNGCWLIAWFDHRVLIDAVAPGRLLAIRELDPAMLLDLRLFGLHGEWRAWRNGDAFDTRRRLDGTGDPCDVLDDDQSLWGTAVQSTSSGGSTLSETRGISFTLPVLVEESNLPLRLRTRQYLAYDSDGMVGVADARLMAFCTWHGMVLVPPKSMSGESK